MISPQQETRLINWLLAETITCVNELMPNFSNRYYLTYFHKILFKTAERNYLPITRSWYKYGGFIHSNLMYQNNISTLKEECIHMNKIKKFRNDVIKFTINKEEILSCIQDEVENTIFKSFKEYLREFYEEAPQRYKLMYLTKFDLKNQLDYVYQYVINQKDYFDFNNIYILISNFHKEIYSIIYDEALNDLILKYTDVFEDVLNKIEIYLESSYEFLPLQLKLLRVLGNMFDEHCWTPCACNISFQTLDGVRRDSEMQRVMRLFDRYIKNSKDALPRFLMQLLNHNMIISYDNGLSYFISHLKSDSEKAFEELFKLYYKYKK